MESAWIRNCLPFQVALRILILKLLEMKHSHVFVLKNSLKFSTGATFGPLVDLLACYSRVEKCFRWHVIDSNLSSISCNFVSPNRCALRDAPQSCFLTSEKTILTSAAWVFNFFLSAKVSAGIELMPGNFRLKRKAQLS